MPPKLCAGASGSSLQAGPYNPIRLNTLEWRDGALVLIDQRWLPGELVYERCTDVQAVARAISELRVRGAPAIGVAAAYGLAIAANASNAGTVDELRRDVEMA